MYIVVILIWQLIKIVVFCSIIYDGFRTAITGTIKSFGRDYFGTSNAIKSCGSIAEAYQEEVKKAGFWHWFLIEAERSTLCFDYIQNQSIIPFLIYNFI